MNYGELGMLYVGAVILFSLNLNFILHQENHKNIRFVSKASGIGRKHDFGLDLGWTIR